MALALMRSSRGHAAGVLSQSQVNPHPRPHPNFTPIALDTPDKGPAHTISTILDPTLRCCTDVHAEKSIESDFAYSVRRAASPQSIHHIRPLLEPPTTLPYATHCQNPGKVGRFLHAITVFGSIRLPSCSSPGAKPPGSAATGPQCSLCRRVA
jgi:hypothetical protein